MQAHLRAHSETWIRASHVDLRASADYAQYSHDFEAGVRMQRGFQKTFSVWRNNAQTWQMDGLGNAREWDHTDPEVFWRVVGLQVWYNAIERQIPSSRDYYDWLAPYLKPGSFKHPSYRALWLEEISGESMPLNRLTGLVEFYQMPSGGHGNATDQLHAGHWLRQDFFFFFFIALQPDKFSMPRAPTSAASR